MQRTPVLSCIFIIFVTFSFSGHCCCQTSIGGQFAGFLSPTNLGVLGESFNLVAVSTAPQLVGRGIYLREQPLQTYGILTAGGSPNIPNNLTPFNFGIIVNGGLSATMSGLKPGGEYNIVVYSGGARAFPTTVSSLGGPLSNLNTSDIATSFVHGSNFEESLLTANSEGSLVFTFTPTSGSGFALFNGFGVQFVRNYVNPIFVSSLSPNEISIATSLNSVAISATGDFNTLLTSIDNLDTKQQIGQAFDQLSPQRLELFRNIAFDNFAFFSQGLDDHLANLHDGMTGLDTTGFAFSDSALGSSLSQIKGHLLAWQPAPTPKLLSDTTSPVLGGVAMSNTEVSDNQRWCAFINGNVVLAQLDSSTDVSHSNYITEGVTLGADYRINRSWTIGALLGYNHTDVGLDNEGSTATVDTYSPGIYASYADHGWYANNLFNYGYNSYTENRNVNFPGVNRTAIGVSQGNQYSSDLDCGYEFHFGNWIVGPSAGLNYVHLDINSFSEAAAGAAGLNIQEQSADSLRSRIGFDTRWNTKYMKTDFTYHLSAHWQHEFMANSLGIVASLETLGVSPFTVQSPVADRDSALLDMGLDVKVSNSSDVFIDYQAEAGQSNFFALSVQGGFKIGF